MASGKKEWQGSHQLGNLECHLLLGGVLVGMGLPFSCSIKDNHNSLQCNMFLVRFWLFVSDEVMVFCLRLFWSVRETPIYVYIWAYMVLSLPYDPTRCLYTMFLLGEIHFQTGVCLRWVFIFYHGKSPVNHHLGDYVLLFWSILPADPRRFATIFNSSYWASSALVHMGLVEPKDEEIIKNINKLPYPNTSRGSVFGWYVLGGPPVIPNLSFGGLGCLRLSWTVGSFLLVSFEINEIGFKKQKNVNLGSISNHLVGTR